ncbi:hypothetical protein BS47DRAFT_1395036 [Hydnum rufescens UP504]|uniref:Uncharacterized protein n=1 Tax=Hydnum rufescens UP504 TaxID=1448309 RepID=A0A9P6AU83_9AGAM|nr:hypothetical protein BS47DRAFT_1395036 [Hydnum rufescens UP504]
MVIGPAPIHDREANDSSGSIVTDSGSIPLTKSHTLGSSIVRRRFDAWGILPRFEFGFGTTLYEYYKAYGDEGYLEAVWAKGTGSRRTYSQPYVSQLRSFRRGRESHPPSFAGRNPHQDWSRPQGPTGVLVGANSRLHSWREYFHILLTTVCDFGDTLLYVTKGASVEVDYGNRVGPQGYLGIRRTLSDITLGLERETKMSEASPHKVGEAHEPADLAGRSVLIDPPLPRILYWAQKYFSLARMSGSHHRDSPLLPSLFRAPNSSTASVQSNLLTHSWRRPATYNIADISSYIASTPLTPITRLKWCKNQDGVRHEFLLLEVERPDDLGTVWLRLERRLHENASVLKSISSPVPSGDTAKICNDVSLLFDVSQSPVQVETVFTAPPPLHRLGNLLSILVEDSPDYKLPSENCYFFCAVIYEILCSTGNGMNVTGTPSRFSLSRGTEAKAKIKKRMETCVNLFITLISRLRIDVTIDGSLVAQSLFLQFSDKVSVVQQAQKKVLRYPPICLQVSDLRSKQNRPVRNLRWGSLFSKSSSSWLEESDRHPRNRNIPMELINVSPGLKAPMQAHFPNRPRPYSHDSDCEKSSKSARRSLRPAQTENTEVLGSSPQRRLVRFGHSGRTMSAPGGPGFDPVTPPRPPWMPAPASMARKIPQPQAIKLYVAVDFGATHSGLSYTTSSNGKVIPIISWPGSSDPFRKIPTCLVYDNLGDLRAWGLQARDINLRRGWLRCEWFKMLLDPESAPSTINTLLPMGKQPADLAVDFLSSLWTVVGDLHMILYTILTPLAGHMLLMRLSSSLDFAEIYLTVPASWDARKSLLLRKMANKAGLVVQVTRKDIYWQERLHIMPYDPETEASAIHSVPLTKFLPDQKFMICDAGGSTVDIATYNIQRAWGTPEIAEACLRSGSYCGSLFLDVYFRELVRARLADHPSHLDESSLAHFLLTFSESEKLRYKGSADDTKMFHFRCLRLQDSPMNPLHRLEDGELIIPGHVLRHEVFDPVINQVVRAIHSHMRDSRDKFKSAIPLIVRPPEGDTASNRGAAQSALHPTVTSVIPSQSVLMRLKLPAEPEDERMRPQYITTSGGTQFCENRLQYIIKKGVGVQKGSRVGTELRKFSVTSYGQDPYITSETFVSSSGNIDSIFETVIYTSNDDKTMRYTDEGETNELGLCRVDLKRLPNFRQRVEVASPTGFCTGVI